MYICPVCQTENRLGAKFCRKCGEARGPEVAGESDPQSAMMPCGDAQVERVDEPSTCVAVLDSAEEIDSQFLEEITEEEVEAELRGMAGNGHPEAEELDFTAEAEPEPMTEVAPQVVIERPRSARPVCSSCGSYVRALDKFCIHCGDRQPQRIPPQMKPCSECRTQLPLSANFCFVCGTDASAQARQKVKGTGELFSEDDPDMFPRFEA